MESRYLAYLVILLTVVTYGLFNFKKLSLPFKLLNLLILFTLLIESMTWSGIYPIENPLILYHILLPFTMFMLYIIFSNLSITKRKIDFIITIVFILSSIINSVWYQTESFPSHGLTLLCNLGIWLSLNTFKDLLLLPTKIDITKHAIFWLSIFTLFFYSITFFTFTFFNLYIEYSGLQDLSFYSNFILYPGYLIALYFDVNRTKSIYENY